MDQTELSQKQKPEGTNNERNCASRETSTYGWWMDIVEICGYMTGTEANDFRHSYT